MDAEKIEKKIVCSAVMDRSGKVHIPLRHRQRLDLVGVQCDVDLIAEIKTIFDKKVEIA